MPLQIGFFIADCMALRIALRKLTRLDSCSATPCATSCASDSGLFTSRMLSCTCLPVSFSSSLRMRSASAPLRPITMPGRADVVGVELVGEPARLPVGGDAETEPGGVNLLTHYSSPSVLLWDAAFFAGAAFFAVAAFLAGAAFRGGAAT